MATDISTLSAERQAEIRAAHDAAVAYEAARRPLAEKVCENYRRGLVTLWEMIEALTEIDIEVTARERGDRQ